VSGRPVSVREYEAYIGEFYVQLTVLHLNKFLYNKNKYMH
jgi:hypothetical protein